MRRLSVTRSRADFMRRFILTGAPGAGKTALIRYLENAGYPVVEEAATDIIAREQQKGVQEPWTDPSFIESILHLQEQRQRAAEDSSADVQFFDRAPLDTYALCLWLDSFFSGHLSSGLVARIKQVQEAGRFEREVFFIESLGFCEPSSARKISYEEALRFSKLHEDVYTESNYRCLNIPPGPVPERAATLLSFL